MFWFNISIWISTGSDGVITYIHLHPHQLGVPLRHAVFRALWIAIIVSNIGPWMPDVVESWLITSPTPSPVLLALVETAGGLPIVLAALPDGASRISSIRRRLLIVMQLRMVIVATAMGVTV